jgi:predicted aldo/keto reductase-like oxidoreductase
VTVAVETLPQRTLGKTGERVPVLGFGTGPTGLSGMSDTRAIDLVEMAIDRGVTYIDTAPGYDNAQRQLSHTVPRRRDEIFLVTKTFTADGKEAIRTLEESLRTMGTDAVDLVYVHSLGSLDVDQVLAADGSLAALREAQKRGLTRYVGFTAHNRPASSQRVLEEEEIDVVMLGLNFADHHTYGFDRTVLPAAAQQNTGVAAMKVYGGALGMKYDLAGDEQERPSAIRALQPHFDHEQALRWALGLPGVSLAVVGMYDERELEQNIEWVKRYEPLSAQQEKHLVDAGRGFASDWGAHYGDVE